MLNTAESKNQLLVKKLNPEAEGNKNKTKPRLQAVYSNKTFKSLSRLINNSTRLDPGWNHCD